MAWKLVRLCLLTLGIVVLLVFPIGTMTISVQLPPSKQEHQPSKTQVFGLKQALPAEIGLLAVIVTFAGWRAYRIIRFHQMTQ